MGFKANKEVKKLII